LTKATYAENGTIEVGGRAIAFRRRAKGVIWFDSPSSFEKPRSQSTSSEIASAYHTVPHLGSEAACCLRRRTSYAAFTWLVDVFYDQRVSSSFSAEAQPEEAW